eukprot:3310741-Heterocapsa_arctica.AAC.1
MGCPDHIPGAGRFHCCSSGGQADIADTADCILSGVPSHYRFRSLGSVDCDEGHPWCEALGVEGLTH